MENNGYKRISSTQNYNFKMWRQLGSSAKARNKLEQTLVEGIHGCDAYLKAGFSPAFCVVSDSALNNPEVIEILSRLDEDDVTTVPDSLFETLSSLEQGIGILFVIDIAQVDLSGLEGDAVILDDVQDPGNVGTLLRTAAAAGVKDVYLSAGSASVWSPRVIRAGMGAQFVLNIYENVNIIELIQESSVEVVSTSLESNKTLYEKDLTTPIAWVFGNEGRGVSDSVLELCSDTVIIPQESAVESLNVAASVAVCLFEQRRQRSFEA